MIHANRAHADKTKEHEYLTGWQRARADLDNFRKSTASQSVETADRHKQDIIFSLLPIADNFQALVQHMPDKLADDSWAQGVIHIARQLDAQLQELGVEQIAAQDQMFDPLLHEAVAQTKQAGVSSGTIVEVVLAGYRIGDSVVRPAKVKVAK